MCRLLAWGSLIGWLGLTSQGVSVAQAGPPQDTVIVQAGKSVPANGGVLVLVPTATSVGAVAKAVPAEIQVTQAGKTIEGSATDIGWIENTTALSITGTFIVGAGLVWTPTEEFLPGATYSIRVSLDSGTENIASFKATDAWTVERPMASLSGELTTTKSVGEVIRCCSLRLDGSGNQGCFVSRHDILPALAPTLTINESADRVEQFVYLFRGFSKDGDITLWQSGFRTFDSQLSYVPFLTPQDPYCIEVVAHHIVDGSEYAWSTCLDASGFDMPPPDPREAIIAALDLKNCSVPEYGDVLQWCEINKKRCASSDSVDCALHGKLCNGTLTDAFEILDAMEKERRRLAVDSGVPSRDAPDGAAVENDGDGGARSGDADERAHGCGCRLNAPRTSPHAFLLLLGLLFVRRLRRSRKLSRAHDSPSRSAPHSP